MLSFEQKDLLKSVVHALEPYEELTDLLSAEQVVTSSSVVPMLKHIKELKDIDVSGLSDVEIHGKVIVETREKIWEYVKCK